MELEILKGKNILFIAVQTFNYETEIANKMRFYGANVDYFDERPINSIFVKGIIRFKRSLYQKRIDLYYHQLLQKAKNGNYDFLFVIKGEVMPSFFLKEFRHMNPKCKFLFYTWDSFANNPNAISILDFFDKKFTFDSNDAVKYQLNFRPLFFIDAYSEINPSHKNIKYSLLFLGTAHSDRYKISNTVVNWCTKKKLSSFAYYFMPSRLVYFFKLMFDRSFKSFDYKKISFKSLNTIDIVNLYQESLVILDINHPGQKGLTMRTFEALGAGKKLITTNKDVERYPFYNENNIFIIDRDTIKLNASFFESPFLKIPDELYQDMSISGWLKAIFIETNPDYWIEGLQ